LKLFSMHAEPHDRLFKAQSRRRAEAALGSRGDGLWRPPPEEGWDEAAKPSQSSSLIFAAIVATLIGAMALVALREKIVRIAPRAAAAYAAIGLPVNVLGLELSGLRSHVEPEGARKALLVEGWIVNLRGDPNPLPPLVLALRGADGQDKYAWTTRAPKARLEGGEKVTFHARLASPPEDGVEVLAHFARNENEAKAK
jgi:hypothetical protein